MSSIKGKDTKFEMLVRKFPHAHGFRYRFHVRIFPGNVCNLHENCKHSVVPKQELNGGLTRLMGM